ncbi:hypothetical protein D3C84_852580 [compost metagenome]
MATFAGSNFLGDAVGFLHRFQRPLRLDEKQPRFGGGLQATALAHEQLEASLMFEVGNGAADGWLRNTQQLCSAGHSAVDHQGSEALELPDSHGALYRFSLYRSHFILLV